MLYMFIQEWIGLVMATDVQAAELGVLPVGALSGRYRYDQEITSNSDKLLDYLWPVRRGNVLQHVDGEDAVQ